MMRIGTIGYFFKEAFKSLRRNGLMTAASVITVAITLFVCGVFWLLLSNINYMAESVESSLEIRAFIKPEVDSQEKIQDLEKKIQSLTGVDQVIFMSKEDALASMKKQFGEEDDLLDALEGENPLPDSFTVKTSNAQNVIAVAQMMEKMPELEKVRYGQGIVEKLLSLINWIRLLGLGIMLLLGLAAVVLIAISIRVTVYARGREIVIMKYVGATNWFIRIPFILEGIFIGLMGSLAAMLLLVWGYTSLVNNVEVTLGFIKLIRDPDLLWQIGLSLIAVGTILGALGSVISLRKFLRV